MTLKIVHSSAKRCLEQSETGYAKTGYGIVQMPSGGVSRQARNLVETLSNFPKELLRGQGICSYSHRCVSIDGCMYHALSKVYPDADGTRVIRTAVHLFLDEMEIQQRLDMLSDCPGPAWFMSQKGFLDNWDGNVDYINHAPQLGNPRVATKPCSYWKEVTGDAGWGGVLAQNYLDHKSVSVVYPQNVDALRLIQESLALLPPRERWNVVFTSLQAADEKFDWRFAVQNSLWARVAVDPSQTLQLDLCFNLGDLPESDAVDAARSGRIIATTHSPSGAISVPFSAQDQPDPISSSISISSELEPPVEAPPVVPGSAAHSQLGDFLQGQTPSPSAEPDIFPLQEDFDNVSRSRTGTRRRRASGKDEKKSGLLVLKRIGAAAFVAIAILIIALLVIKVKDMAGQLNNREQAGGNSGESPETQTPGGGDEADPTEPIQPQTEPQTSAQTDALNPTEETPEETGNDPPVEPIDPVAEDPPEEGGDPPPATPDVALSPLEFLREHVEEHGRLIVPRWQFDERGNTVNTNDPLLIEDLPTKDVDCALMLYDIESLVSDSNPSRWMLEKDENDPIQWWIRQNDVLKRGMCAFQIQGGQLFIEWKVKQSAPGKTRELDRNLLVVQVNDEPVICPLWEPLRCDDAVVFTEGNGYEFGYMGNIKEKVTLVDTALTNCPIEHFRVEYGFKVEPVEPTEGDEDDEAAPQTPPPPPPVWTTSPRDPKEVQRLTLELQCNKDGGPGSAKPRASIEFHDNWTFVFEYERLIQVGEEQGDIQDRLDSLLRQHEELKGNKQRVQGEVDHLLRHKDALLSLKDSYDSCHDRQGQPKDPRSRVRAAETMTRFNNLQCPLHNNQMNREIPHENFQEALACVNGAINERNNKIDAWNVNIHDLVAEQAAVTVIGEQCDAYRVQLLEGLSIQYRIYLDVPNPVNGEEGTVPVLLISNRPEDFEVSE